MTSVDEQGKAATDDAASTLSVAEINAYLGSFFDKGDQLATLLENLGYGIRPYTARDDRAYRELRGQLLNRIRILGATMDVMYGEPSDASAGLMVRLVNEAFPATLADHYEVAGWRRHRWERLQGVALTLLEVLGVDPFVPVADGDVTSDQSVPTPRSVRKSRGRAREISPKEFADVIPRIYSEIEGEEGRVTHALIADKLRVRVSDKTIERYVEAYIAAGNPWPPPRPKDEG
jgi:hypothetical protein